MRAESLEKKKAATARASPPSPPPRRRRRRRRRLQDKRGLRQRQHAALVDFVREGNACTTCTVKLFFVHLHKCGGTTLEAHLLDVYGDRYLVPDTGDEIELRDALVRQNASRLAALRAGVAGYRVFARHIAYGFHAAVGCQRPLYLTMLREPVARLLSIFG